MALIFSSGEMAGADEMDKNKDVRPTHKNREDDENTWDLYSNLLEDEIVVRSEPQKPESTVLSTMERLRLEVLKLKRQNEQLRAESDETLQRLRSKDSELSQLKKRTLECSRCSGSIHPQQPSSSCHPACSFQIVESLPSHLSGTTDCHRKKRRRISPQLIVRYSESSLSNLTSHAPFTQVGKGDTFHEYLKIFPESQDAYSQSERTEDNSNDTVVSEKQLCMTPSILASKAADVTGVALEGKPSEHANLTSVRTIKDSGPDGVSEKEHRDIVSSYFKEICPEGLIITGKSTAEPSNKDKGSSEKKVQSEKLGCASSNVLNEMVNKKSPSKERKLLSKHKHKSPTCGSIEKDVQREKLNCASANLLNEMINKKSPSKERSPLSKPQQKGPANRLQPHEHCKEEHGGKVCQSIFDSVRGIWTNEIIPQNSSQSKLPTNNSDLNSRHSPDHHNPARKGDQDKQKSSRESFPVKNCDQQYGSSSHSRNHRNEKQPKVLEQMHRSPSKDKDDYLQPVNSDREKDKNPTSKSRKRTLSHSKSEPLKANSEGDEVHKSSTGKKTVVKGRENGGKLLNKSSSNKSIGASHKEKQHSSSSKATVTSHKDKNKAHRSSSSKVAAVTYHNVKGCASKELPVMAAEADNIKDKVSTPVSKTGSEMGCKEKAHESSSRKYARSANNDSKILQTSSSKTAVIGENGKDKGHQSLTIKSERSVEPGIEDSNNRTKTRHRSLSSKANVAGNNVKVRRSSSSQAADRHKAMNTVDGTSSTGNQRDKTHDPSNNLYIVAPSPCDQTIDTAKKAVHDFRKDRSTASKACSPEPAGMPLVKHGKGKTGSEIAQRNLHGEKMPRKPTEPGIKAEALKGVTLAGPTCKSSGSSGQNDAGVKPLKWETRMHSSENKTEKKAQSHSSGRASKSSKSKNKLTSKTKQTEDTSKASSKVLKDTSRNETKCVKLKADTEKKKKPTVPAVPEVLRISLYDESIEDDEIVMDATVKPAISNAKRSQENVALCPQDGSLCPSNAEKPEQMLKDIASRPDKHQSPEPLITKSRAPGAKSNTCASVSSASDVRKTNKKQQSSSSRQRTKSIHKLEKSDVKGMETSNSARQATEVKKELTMSKEEKANLSKPVVDHRPIKSFRIPKISKNKDTPTEATTRHTVRPEQLTTCAPPVMPLVKPEHLTACALPVVQPVRPEQLTACVPPVMPPARPEQLTACVPPAMPPVRPEQLTVCVAPVMPLKKIIIPKLPASSVAPADQQKPLAPRHSQNNDNFSSSAEINGYNAPVNVNDIVAATMKMVTARTNTTTAPLPISATSSPSRGTPMDFQKSLHARNANYQETQILGGPRIAINKIGAPGLIEKPSVQPKLVSGTMTAALSTHRTPLPFVNKGPAEHLDPFALVAKLMATINVSNANVPVANSNVPVANVLQSLGENTQQPVVHTADKSTVTAKKDQGHTKPTKPIPVTKPPRTTYPVAKPAKVLSITSDDQHLLQYFSSAKRRNRELFIDHRRFERSEQRRRGAKRTRKENSLAGEEEYGGSAKMSAAEPRKTDTVDGHALSSEQIEELWNIGIDPHNPDMVAAYFREQSEAANTRTSNMKPNDTGLSFTKYPAVEEPEAATTSVTIGLASADTGLHSTTCSASEDCEAKVKLVSNVKAVNDSVPVDMDTDDVCPAMLTCPAADVGQTKISSGVEGRDARRGLDYNNKQVLVDPNLVPYRTVNPTGVRTEEAVSQRRRLLELELFGEHSLQVTCDGFEKKPEKVPDDAAFSSTTCPDAENVETKSNSGVGKSKETAKIVTNTVPMDLDMGDKGLASTTCPVIERARPECHVAKTSSGMKSEHNGMAATSSVSMEKDGGVTGLPLTNCSSTKSEQPTDSELKSSSRTESTHNVEVTTKSVEIHNNDTDGTILPLTRSPVAKVMQPEDLEVTTHSGIDSQNNVEAINNAAPVRNGTDELKLPLTASRPATDDPEATTRSAGKSGHVRAVTDTVVMHNDAGHHLTECPARDNCDANRSSGMKSGPYVDASSKSQSSSTDQPEHPVTTIPCSKLETKNTPDNSDDTNIDLQMNKAEQVRDKVDRTKLDPDEEQPVDARAQRSCTQDPTLVKAASPKAQSAVDEVEKGNELDMSLMLSESDESGLWDTECGKKPTLTDHKLHPPNALNAQEGGAASAENQRQRLLEIELFGEDSLQVTCDGFEGKVEAVDDSVQKEKRIIIDKDSAVGEKRGDSAEPCVTDCGDEDSDLDVGDTEFAIDPSEVKVEIDVSEDSLSSWNEGEEVSFESTNETISVESMLRSSSDINNISGIAPIAESNEDGASHQGQNSTVSKSDTAAEVNICLTDEMQNDKIDEETRPKIVLNHTSEKEEQVVELAEGKGDVTNKDSEGDKNILEVAEGNKDADDVTEDSFSAIDESSDGYSEGACGGDEMSEDPEATLVDEANKDDKQDKDDTCSLASESGGSSLHCRSTTVDEMDDLDDELTISDSLEKNLLTEERLEAQDATADKREESDGDFLEIHAGDISIFDEDSLLPSKISSNDSHTPRRSPRKKPCTSTPQLSSTKARLMAGRLEMTPTSRNSAKILRHNVSPKKPQGGGIKPALVQKKSDGSEEGELLSDEENGSPKESERHNRHPSNSNEHFHGKRRRHPSRERDNKRLRADVEKRGGGGRYGKQSVAPSVRYSVRRLSPHADRKISPRPDSRRSFRRSSSPMPIVSSRRVGREEHYGRSHRHSEHSSLRSSEPLSRRRR